MNKKDFKFTCDHNGYWLYYRGRLIGGNKSAFRVKKTWLIANAAKEFFKTEAEKEIKELLKGQGQETFKKQIRIINLREELREHGSNDQ